MATIDVAKQDAAGAARRHSGWIVKVARAGYAAKGVIYVIIGVLALQAALGAGGGTTDSGGALQVVEGSPFGRALLGVMGVGLIGYALWALLSASLDAEDRGTDAKGIALRIGQAARGIAYGALGVEALRLLSRASSGSAGGQRAEHWSARALELPWGRALLAAVGLGVIAYALYQFYRGAQKDIQKRLHIGGDPDVRRGVVKLARFGIIARGVVFLMIGWFVTQAALQSDPGRAGGIQESLSAIQTGPLGRVVLGIVAAGLIGYGVWQFANARYREMNVS